MLISVILVLSRVRMQGKIGALNLLTERPTRLGKKCSVGRDNASASKSGSEGASLSTHVRDLTRDV